MKRSAEFLIFCVLAACMHLGIVFLLDAEQEVSAGVAAGGGQTAVGAAGDLADLIESWDRAPDHQSVEGQTEADFQTPEDLSEIQTSDVAALDQPPEIPQPKVGPADAPAVPQVRNVTQQPQPVEPPTTAVPRVQTPDKAITPQDQLQRPKPPIAPKAVTPVTRAQEPPPEVQKPETGPAPLIAALPKAKPEVPEWARPKPRQQPTKSTKKPKKQPAKKQPGKQPTQAKPTARAQTAARPTQQGQRGQQGIVAKPNIAARATAKPGPVTSAGQGYSDRQIKNARNKYIAAVHKAIARKKQYPRKAKRRGITGRATIRVTLSASGKLLSVSLAQSSGSDLLDKEALTAARRVSSYPRIPKEMGRAQATIRFGVPFRLN